MLQTNVRDGTWEGVITLFEIMALDLKEMDADKPNLGQRHIS